MLVEFTVGNFLSFNEKRRLSFEAKGISELRKNTMVFGRQKLLRSAVVYGANSSGKSNLIKALARMQDMVMSSVKLNDHDDLNFTPFLLSVDHEHSQTHFEAIFITKNEKYRYGFEYNQGKIVNEWLFEGQNIKTQKVLFLRTEDGIGVSESFNEGNGKESATNNNRLFLSLVAQLGGSVSKTIIEWFRSYKVISGFDHEDFIGQTTRMLHNKLRGYSESMSLFKKLQLGFKDLVPYEIELSPLDALVDSALVQRAALSRDFSGKKQIVLMAAHNRFDDNGKIIDTISWNRDENESDGTNKIIDLAGPLADTLSGGKLLVIDELDAKLHPLITINLVNLFNDPKTNPNGAQLFFATHDTNLLSSNLFRRDQILFTEKDHLEQTDLYSLYDVNLPDGTKVRNDGNYERNYIRGRYGAIPFITN